jgi:hypothetical protein
VSGVVFIFCTLRPVLGGTDGVGYNFHDLRLQTRFRRYRGRRLPFSCVPLPNLFSTVPRVSSPIFMFCAPELVLYGTKGHRVRYSCFALPASFSAVPRASGPIFMFCAPRFDFDSNEDVSRARVRRYRGRLAPFPVLRSRTHFWWYLGRRVQFSCFKLLNSFSAVPRASGPFFMYYAFGHVLGSTEGVGSSFHVLRYQNRFRRYRRRRVSLSCFALLD